MVRDTVAELSVPRRPSSPGGRQVAFGLPFSERAHGEEETRLTGRLHARNMKEASSPDPPFWPEHTGCSSSLPALGLQEVLVPPRVSY